MIWLLFACCAFSIFFSYIGYPIILAYLQRIRPVQQVARDLQQTPSLSLIIAAYNEEKDIEARLINALACDYPKQQYEIIIASDGSDDATVAIVERIAAQHPQVRLFAFAQRRGKVNVLNEVVPQAKGSILVFSDANVTFANNTLRELVSYFTDAKVGTVCGKLNFMQKGQIATEPEGLYWKLESWLKLQEGLRGSTLGANGGNFAMRANLWQGCEADTLVEDFVIPMRLLRQGWHTVFAPTAQAWEEVAPTIKDEFGRRIRIGAGGYQAITRLKGLLSPQYGFRAFAFFSHKVLRWLTPHALILMWISTLILSLQGDKLAFLLWLGQSGIYVNAWRLGLNPTNPPRFKVLGVLHQFLVMNAALFLGFIRWFKGQQQVTWQRTARQ